MDERKRQTYIAQNPLQWEWGFASFANGSCHNGICWGHLLELAQFIEIHFLPHLESFMWEQKFVKKISKKNPIQPSNEILPICKLPFQNGSYRNGVCRALWAESNIMIFGMSVLRVKVYMCIFKNDCFLWNSNSNG